MVTWALPPLIMENDLARVQKQIQLLLRTGFRSFQLGHLSQKLLFKGEKAHLFADYTANLYNNQAVAMAGEIGIGAVQAGIEMDRPALEELFIGCRAGGELQGLLGKGEIFLLVLWFMVLPPCILPGLLRSICHSRSRSSAPEMNRMLSGKKKAIHKLFRKNPFRFCLISMN